MMVHADKKVIPIRKVYKWNTLKHPVVQSLIQEDTCVNYEKTKIK